MDVNVGINGLRSLGKFIQMAAEAETMEKIKSALDFKQRHSISVSQEYIKKGMKEYIYT